MANEVNININAHNLTGPGFASATASAITFGNVITNVTNKFGGARTAATALNKSLADNNSMLEKGVRTGGLYGGVIQALTSHIKLFGGALSQAGLPKFLSSVSGWHLLTEAVIEFTAVWAPAALAVGAFGLAAAPVADDIYKRMKSLYTASTALGQSVYPLKGTFQDVESAVKPEVYTLFGEALVYAGRSGDSFKTMATGVGHQLDILGARFIYATEAAGSTGKFAEQANKDFTLIGDSIANFGTILGVVFKAVPGYAETLLGIGNSTLHFIAAVAQATEPVLKFGLAAHGALIYIGLLSTGVTKLVTGGLGMVENMALKAGVAIVGFGSAGAKAGEGLAKVSDWAGKAGSLPWGWIGVAAAGLVILGIQLSKVSTDATRFNDSMQTALSKSSLQNLPTTMLSALSQTEQKLTQSTKDLAAEQNSLSKSQHVGIGDAEVYQAKMTVLEQNTKGYSDGLAKLKDQAGLVSGRVSDLSKTYGGNANALALMNGAGITTDQLLDTSGTKWAEATIEIEAYGDAIKAVTGGTGRYGAALNALNFESGDSANNLGKLQGQIKQITQAEDDMLNTLLGGQQGFVTFNQNLEQMGVDAGVSDGYLKQNLYTQKITGQTMILGTKNIGDLNDASLKLASDFYSNVIPSAQQLNDSLQKQMINTKDLTTVVATEAGSMLSMAGNNDAARLSIVDFINNALGPGTVNMENLNKWVGQNTTSMQGFKAIVDKTQASASKLAGTLNDDLNAMFAQDILKATGADKALQTYTNDITHNQTATAKGKTDRQKLIKDLEDSGMSADAAKRYVDNLQTSINNLKGKKVNIQMDGTGNYTIAQVGALTGNSNYGKGVLLNAVGGYISQGTGPKSDDVLSWLSHGEYVVQADAVNKYGLGMLEMINAKQYAGGGYITGNLHPSFPGDMEHEFQSRMTNSMVAAMRAAMKAAEAAAAASQSSGALGGDAATNKALAKSMFPWGSDQWASFDYVEMREAGYNRFARNPSSGAYGMPQALPESKLPAAGQSSGGSHAGPQLSWMFDYIRGRYGNPAGAAAHERNQNWYNTGGPVFDSGGWLNTGWNHVYNGTGAREHLTNTTNGGAVQLEISAGGQSAFEAFMLKMMREFVRVKGGGDVQKAFGGRK